ncbi:hypothetical protein ACEWY4_013071 [Coilia grayii]|uniref:EGF-like calcium-binding domain-containing protein n=1 Tax=Coilia grayii TaxID=363190 RepID=A0ABD1JVA8_9TELE
MEPNLRLSLKPEAQHFDPGLQDDAKPLPELLDVNECEETNGGCEALCCNTIGSFYCKCPDGQELREDGKTCKACTNSISSLDTLRAATTDLPHASYPNPDLQLSPTSCTNSIGS